MRIRSLMTLALMTFFLLSASDVSGQDKKGWIPLLNGKDLTGWHLRKAEGPNGWKVIDHLTVNTPPSTDLQTDAEYYDFQLHVEFKVTAGDGNSGVYMRDKYEVQIFNSFGKPAVDTGCGALYKKIAPSVNASKREGEWQTYDITFIGRRLTVIHNGHKVLDNVDVGTAPTARGLCVCKAITRRCRFAIFVFGRYRKEKPRKCRRGSIRAVLSTPNSNGFLPLPQYNFAFQRTQLRNIMNGPGVALLSEYSPACSHHSLYRNS